MSRIHHLSGLCMILALLCLAPWASAAVNLAKGGNNIVMQAVARNAVHEPMLQVNLTCPSTQPAVEITELKVTASANGTAHDVNNLIPQGVELYWDKNGDGRLTQLGSTINDDLLLGSGSFNADNGTVTFSGFTVSIFPGKNTNLIVLYTLAPTATAGKSFQARIASATGVKARDAATQAPVAVAGQAVEGYLRTVGHGTLTFVKLKQSPDGAVAIPNRKLLPLINLQAHADDVEDIVINSINFSDIGTANAVTGILPHSVRLFAFGEKSTSVPTRASDAVSTASFQADNGIVTLTPSKRLAVPRGSSLKLWVTIDTVDANTGVIGSKYQVKLPSTNPLQATGAYSTDPPHPDRDGHRRAAHQRPDLGIQLQSTRLQYAQ